jgi:hypothetical protein
MRTDTLNSRSFRTCHRLARRFAIVLCVVSILLPIAVSLAVEGISLDVARVDGPGWSASGLSFEVRLGDEGIAATATVATAAFAGLGLSAERIAIACADLDLDGSMVTCRSARVQAQVEGMLPQDVIGHVAYDRASGGLEFAFDNFALADGTATIAGSWQAPAWQARIGIVKASAAALIELAARVSKPMGGLTAVGTVAGTIEANGVDGSLTQLTADIELAALTAANEAGTMATDSLVLTGRGTAHRAPHGWTFDVQATAPAGQFYFQPVFADLAGGSIDLAAAGQYDDDQRLHIEHFALDHRNAARVEGSADIVLREPLMVAALDARLEEVTLPGAFKTYAQPFLIDTALASLETTGRLSGSLHVVDGAPAALDLDIESVSVDDGAGTFAIAGLDGAIHWDAEEAREDVEEDAGVAGGPLASHLEWRDGSLLGLAIGAARLEFTTRGRGMRLVEPATVPVLDGSVDLEALRIRNAGTDKVAFLIGAEIRPVSVARICNSFGWPEFGGTLAGSIRKLRMREGVVSLGTTLEARVFDGTVRIGDLKLEHPFGDWPRLFANVELDNLDLDHVTSAFEFGRITGRLGGHISGLELFNWMPVAFDASLATPPRDRSRHRISQRAVENIGSLGGSSAGITAALSSGFLRFFEDFNYDRLGITCRLRNEVCEMGGVAPAENGGYYLVKGKGVPRIDVIGNRRRVDWPRLVRQLVAIVESEGPVVE